MKTRLLIFFIILLASSPGCAFMNRDNTLLFNQVEEHLVPEDTGWQVAAFPLTFPVGLVALTIDAAIIHPGSVVLDTAEDTADALWDNFDWDEQYVTECAQLPWRAIFTPVVFTGAYLGRSFFDIPRRAAEEREDEEEAGYPEIEEQTTTPEKGIPELYKTARELLAEKNAVDCIPIIHELWKRVDQDVDRLLLKKMSESNDPAFRWIAFQTSMQFGSDDIDRKTWIRTALSDLDPFLRYSALQWISHTVDGIKRYKVRSRLERMAKRDADPMVRAFAILLLESG